ncbi:MAG TPA: crosslink repair DNA glycosylase YcaQ family protein [Bacteroidota bacterium]|nr:crosslink repair DNA glycosylase YcaQ family protein [Bacteroidota bacterium]
MSDFHPVIRDWFLRTYGEPTPAQTLGWPSISSGQHTLILAPTGSGKTLAAFLWAINHIFEERLAGDVPPGVGILYISPLKALNNDVDRNLAGPLESIRRAAAEAGLRAPAIRSAVRTGDTPQAQRASMMKHPPDILITTPESLYLMLTSRGARPMFRTVRYVIVDEIHALCGNKRGVHLSLSLERLQEVALQEFIRIGLSATQRPLDEIAAFLGGLHAEGGRLAPRPVSVIDAGHRKSMDISVECAPPDFSLLTQEGVWPLVFEEILALIALHTTTLIFVNNRRLAERVAAALNDALQNSEPPEVARQEINLHAVPRFRTGTDEPLVQAYHGSMSRQARERMESDLKNGKLRALVATSSLELGIDIGSIDLVIQLQSPRGIARGLQRIGRSGHLVTATSKGRIFPTHREDLVESAVVARGIASHEVERTVIPSNCLDVLAQQIVAMVSVEDRDVDGLFALVRASYCYRDLSRTLFDGVIQMLAGRYAEGTLRELRGVVSWDRVNDVLRALPGSGRIAVTGGGTIADRGYYGVYLGDGSTKVGEVDEEFVFETRVGDTFILGSSVWRVDEIEASRLTVSPAPGQPARMPFWRGEGIGRSYELGCAVGAFRRQMEETIDRPESLTELRAAYPIDARSAWNIREYFRKQRDTTGVIPHDRRLVVETFRDEIGDPRLVVHSSFGRRVNGLLGLLLARRLHDRAGVEPQMLYNDDGILLRSSGSEMLPDDLLDGIDASAARQVVLDEVLSSPLFGGQFRQNAARALLMPGKMPGKRTPLWLQRLRAGDLLQIARRYDDFPIVIETVREILHDILDFDHFMDLLRGIEGGSIGVTRAASEIPSPFAASLLFDFIAVYMYEYDQPREDRLSQYLAVNREILGELIDLDSVSTMVRPEAIAAVERQLQHAADGTRARSAEELMEILLRIGDLSDAEIAERCEGDPRAMLSALERDGRIARVEFPGGPRWIAAEEAPLYRSLPAERSAVFILGRYLRSHGPRTSRELGERFGTSSEDAERVARVLAGEKEVVRSRFTPGEGPGGGPREGPGTVPGVEEEQWCAKGALERIHRQTITILRKEITPSSPAEFTAFLFRWQGIGRGVQGDVYPDSPGALSRLEGLPLPADVWERDILRVRRIPSESIERLSREGGGAWVGSAPGRIRFILRGNGGLYLGPPASEEGLREHSRNVLAFLKNEGASFFSDIRDGTRLSLQGLNTALAELFWNGLITNDVFAEATAVRRMQQPDADARFERIEIVNPHRAPARARLMQSARKALREVPGWSGRWSILRTRGLMGGPPHEEERAQAQAMLLLDRYGIVAREFLAREDLVGWSFIAQELNRMELKGEVRRGYFVEGLSGMQFALPGAVEELRRARSGGTDGPIVLLNACDPANPFGPGIPLRGAGGEDAATLASRVQSTYVAFAGGAPVLVFESWGARIRTVGSPAIETVREGLSLFTGLLRLPGRLRPFREIIVEYCNDIRPAESPLATELGELGFVRDSNQRMRRDEYA